MKLVISLTIDGPSFTTDEGPEAEVERLLADYAGRLRDGLVNLQFEQQKMARAPLLLRDSTGTQVGEVRIIESKDWDGINR